MNRVGLRILAGAAAALIIGVGSRNYFIYRAAGRPVPLWESIAGEVPVWIGWVALAPLIVALGRRWPPIGAHAFRNGFIHMVAAFAGSAVVTVLIVGSRGVLPNTPSPWSIETSFVTFVVQAYATVAFSFLFVYVSILGSALAASYYLEQQRRQVRESQLQTLLANAERDLLRMQLHPHFLFNTLHAISALMSSDVSAARRMMVKLSDLLRMSFDENAPHEVTLAEEMTFLNGYLDIQLIRFGERLSVETSIAPETSCLLVPRLILQPIVENALVHGLGPVERGGTVMIAAEINEGSLVITVSDDGAGMPADRRQGVGLGNSRARLVHLYGAQATLVLEPADPVGTRTRLVIPLHTEPVASEQRVLLPALQQ